MDAITLLLQGVGALGGERQISGGVQTFSTSNSSSSTSWLMCGYKYRIPSSRIPKNSRRFNMGARGTRSLKNTYETSAALKQRQSIIAQASSIPKSRFNKIVHNGND